MSVATPTLPPEPARRWHAWLVLWRVHRWLGLVLGALLVLTSLTGSLLVMHAELERLVEPGRHTLATPPAGVRVPIVTLVRTVAAEAPAGYRPLRVLLAQAPDQTEQLIFVAPDGRTRWTAIVNPYTGEILWSGPDRSLVASWLLALHMHLHLGSWGYVITGCGAAALFLLGLSGLYIHRNRLGVLCRRPFHFGHGWRAVFRDLHNWLGIVSVYFSLMLGLTGLIYAIKIAPGQLAAPKPLGTLFDLASLAPIEPAISSARERFPGAELLRVSFPTSASAPLTILALHRNAPVWRKFSRIDFDPSTGAVCAVRDAQLATPGEKFASMLAPLHFGFYGASWVKWTYIVGGLSPALLAITGFFIWRVRISAAS